MDVCVTRIRTRKNKNAILVAGGLVPILELAYAYYNCRGIADLPHIYNFSDILEAINGDNDAGNFKSSRIVNVTRPRSR